MAMTINTNVVSINAQRNLSLSGGSLSTTMQRLSSGLRVNSAKDDAAGLAIAERMNAQSKGMAVAARNANDGISLAQTAEGALGKVGDMLQRMRELAVQSSNATNSEDDRKALQAEVSQLSAEIDRVAKTTSFNGQKILDGSFSGGVFQIGASAGDNITVGGITNAKVNSLSNVTFGSYSSDAISADGIHNFASKIEKGALSIRIGTGTEVKLDEIAAANSGQERLGQVVAAINAKTADTGVAAFLVEGKSPGEFKLELRSSSDQPVSLSGFTASTTGVGAALGVGFEAGAGKAGGDLQAFQDQLDKVLKAANGGEAVAIVDVKTLQAAAANALAADAVTALAKTGAAGTKAEPLTAALEEFRGALMGFTDSQTTIDVATAWKTGTDAEDVNAAVKAATQKLQSVFSSAVEAERKEVFKPVETALQTFENSVTKAADFAGALTTLNGVLDPAATNFLKDVAVAAPTDEAAVKKAVADVIANVKSQMSGGFGMTASEVTKHTGIEGMDISTQAGAWEALSSIDSAIDQVNASRADLGALQTRFEKAIENIDIQNENISAARGRIVDADFAVETANLSRSQILQQAGTAMVAQANQMSQGVLSLLQ